MAFICDNCHTRFRSTPARTFTGRRLCQACNAWLLGATAGVMSGGAGGVSTSMTDAEISALAVGGWTARVRAWLRRDRPTER
jgi:hypothetical protein